MKNKTLLLLIFVVLLSCNEKKADKETTLLPTKILGTWKLIKSMVIEKQDTVLTNYTANASFIKIINESHFAFLQHDLKREKDSVSLFVAGGGTYSLTYSFYIEHLEYCSDRNWEGNDFAFTIHLKNDTLIQSGIEKIESSGINRFNIETYIRLRK